MKPAQFQILLSGRLLPGRHRSEAVAGLAQVLRIPADRAERMLLGRPTRLKAPLSREQADRVVERLGSCGVECSSQSIGGPASLEPETAGLSVEMPTMRCPKCGEEQPEAMLCRSCGIAVKKAASWAEGRKAKPRPRAPAQSGFPYHLLNRLLQFLILLTLALAILAYLKKDQLPAPEFYDRALLTEPVQSETRVKPFQTEVNGIVYTIEPLFEYELNGLVVSYHDSDAFIDVYHHKDWKDFLNIRDLCVIWGENVASGVYHELEVSNTTWTCWVSWNDRGVGERFTMSQLSNNHLLANDVWVNERIMEAEPGDQIAFSGVLASYSHSDGQFQRGSSTTRTDTGNGACETVFLRDFRIVKKANRGWRKLYSVSRVLAVVSLLGIIVLMFIAPVHRGVKG